MEQQLIQFFTNFVNSLNYIPVTQEEFDYYHPNFSRSAFSRPPRLMRSYNYGPRSIYRIVEDSLVETGVFFNSVCPYEWRAVCYENSIMWLKPRDWNCGIGVSQVNIYSNNILRS